jgi:hypothetical protein
MAFIAARTAEEWQMLMERWYGDPANYPPVTRRTRPESLIAAGVTASAQKIDAGVLTVTLTAVVAACAFWWTYFSWVKDALEEGLAAQPPAHVGRFARDVYSFAHFRSSWGCRIRRGDRVGGSPKDSWMLVASSPWARVALILGGAALALVSDEGSIVRWLIIAITLLSRSWGWFRLRHDPHHGAGRGSRQPMSAYPPA